jgi:hypothetical protein
MTKVEELQKAFPMMATLFADCHAEGVAEGFAEGVEDTTSALALVWDAEVFAIGVANGAELVKQEIQDYIEANDEYISPSDLLQRLNGIDPSVLAPKEKP